MNKELTPLEAFEILKETIFHHTRGCLTAEEKKALIIVEKSLTEYLKTYHPCY